MDRRNEIIKIAWELLNNKRHCYYSEGSNRWGWHQHKNLEYPFISDCYGTVTAICYFAKGNDPGDVGFSYGNTLTGITHARRAGLIITHNELLFGDFVYLGLESDGVTPKHVVLAMQRGTNLDPICFSMGKQGDPSLVKLSVLVWSIGAATYVRNVTRV